MTKLAYNTVASRFEHAAEHYDRAASVQAQVAEQLIQKAVASSVNPASILDIGCGTGFAAAVAAKYWPQAAITGLDVAPAMLKEASRKIPRLRVIEGDVAQQQFGPQFDLVLSSMALQWLPDPQAALEKWRRWLTPNGKLFVAILVDGSFQEWRDICRTENLIDGLRFLPCPDFAGQWIIDQQKTSVNYPSAMDFFRRMKTIGASLPRAGHKPFDIPTMRRLLVKAPQPFIATYNIAYIYAPSPDSI